MNPVNNPLSIVMGRIENVSKRDAKSYCRSMITRLYENPYECFYTLIERNDIYYYEIHEGGEGKGFLSAVLKHLDGKDDGATVTIGCAGKWVSATKYEGEVFFKLIPKQDQVMHPDEFLDTEKMRRWENDLKDLLPVSYIFSAAGGIVLLAAAILWGSSFWENEVKYEVPHALSTLPDAMERMERMKSSATGTYVKKLEYKDGKWSVQLGR